MQLPFSGRAAGVCVSVEERNERKAQQLRRLQEINSRRREEKLQEDQKRLETLLSVQVYTFTCREAKHSCMHSVIVKFPSGAAGGWLSGTVSQESGGAQHGLS